MWRRRWGPKRFILLHRVFTTSHFKDRKMNVFSVHMFVFSGQIPVSKPTSVTVALKNAMPNCPSSRSWDILSCDWINLLCRFAQAVKFWEILYVKYAAGFVAWLFHFFYKISMTPKTRGWFCSTKISRQTINKHLITSLFFTTSKKTALFFVSSLCCTTLLVDCWTL